LKVFHHPNCDFDFKSLGVGDFYFKLYCEYSSSSRCMFVYSITQSTNIKIIGMTGTLF